MAEESSVIKADLAKKRWHVFGLIAICFVAGFFGAWVFIASGLTTINSSSIESNRETIVLQEGEVIAEIFKKVSPSAVAITTEQVSGGTDFLGPYISRGSGSGVVVSGNGYILTNKHVVAKVDTVTVTLSDGTKYDNARVIGRDPINDIAFIKIDDVNLTVAELGDSSAVLPGQKVVAIGNALGEFSNSITSGIISGIGRPIAAANGLGSAEKLENLLQTDAAINPGNSGGPLVNLQGQVIGINTAVSSQGEGLGFAIPIDDVKNTIDSILKEGRIIKPYLGVRYVIINNEIASSLGLSSTTGALILGSEGEPAVIPGSPADKAGLRADDVITKVGDEEVNERRGLATIISRFRPGDELELTVIRDDNEQKVKVVLEEFKQ